MSLERDPREVSLLVAEGTLFPAPFFTVVLLFTSPYNILGCFWSVTLIFFSWYSASPRVICTAVKRVTGDQYKNFKLARLLKTAK